ncbi:MAG: aspartate kinase [Candidatus Bathyarchaeota archaeon]|nr:aspartate kinase [Candidatus Bathyarchaeota archaeon]
MGGRVIVKFGGADLSSGEKIKKAAEMVIKANFEEVIVVVSAMGDTTDKLIKIISEIGNISDKDYADIVSMGERTSARIFCSALKVLGADAVYIEPSHEFWPIITDSNFRDAEPIMEETCRRVIEYIEPLLLEKKIVVVCGFLGKDKDGNVTTLGRGGSDTTALILANCLKSDEVILVKETEGVLSADPKMVQNPRIIDKIDIHEMFALAHGGAKIIKAEALKYKLPEQKLRVVSFSSGNLRSPGTEIIGVFNSNSFEIKEREGLAAISLICDITPESFSRIFAALTGNEILGVSTGKRSITVFVMTQNLKDLMNKLHGLSDVKALSCLTNIGLIEVSHPIFVDSPGWVAKIASALASKGINIIEITTSKATINIFISEARIKEAINVVRDALEA